MAPFQKSVSETHFRNPCRGNLQPAPLVVKSLYGSAGPRGRGEMLASSATVTHGG